MPGGWVHATFDLITCGRPYFDLHKQKDKDHETLGSQHRLVNHEWYWAYRKHWTLSDPVSPSHKELHSKGVGCEGSGQSRTEDGMAHP